MWWLVLFRMTSEQGEPYTTIARVEANNVSHALNVARWLIPTGLIVCASVEDLSDNELERFALARQKPVGH